MGGPNLEVFKFSLYLFVPIFALVHFGDPEWYRQNVVPVCSPRSLIRVIHVDLRPVSEQVIPTFRTHKPGTQIVY